VLGAANHHLHPPIIVNLADVAINALCYVLDEPLGKTGAQFARGDAESVLVVNCLVQLARRSRHLHGIIVP
jgi:hypothetical protein